jgi:tetratricopeptide (TPR) repeat protein
VRGWPPLPGLPPLARWSVLGVGGFLLALLVWAGVWSVLQHRDASAQRAFTSASATYRQAMVSDEEPRLGDAAAALRQFLTDYSRSSDAAHAWYALGNLEYRQRHYDSALSAFGEAASRDRGSVGALSRLGVGYVWEAKKDPARALTAYGEALKGRGPTDFLYGELLLATARVQEELKQPAAAVESYRRLLKDAPGSSRAEEARTRLAILGAGAA